jgi:hypothetical protein
VLIQREKALFCLTDLGLPEFFGICGGCPVNDHGQHHICLLNCLLEWHTSRKYDQRRPVRLCPFLMPWHDQNRQEESEPQGVQCPEGRFCQVQYYRYNNICQLEPA